MSFWASIKEKIERIKPKVSVLPWRSIFVFLFFLIIAYIFWLMLFFQQENVDGTYRIPLKYTNVPEDVVFNNPLPGFIDISVSDKGSEIFMLDIKKQDSMEIDVGMLKDEGVSTLQGDQLRQYIRSYLAPSTNIKGYFPMNINLKTSKLESKELRVRFDGEITTSRGNLVADSVTFIPEKVIAYGSRESLKALRDAPTEFTVINNLKATSQLPINISAVEGVKFSPSSVEIYIPVKEYTEQSFDVPIEASHVPKNLDVKFFPSRAKVTFSVTLDDYKKIAQEDFAIVLDYRKFSKNEDGKVQLELTDSPSTILEPRISPSTVEFLFETSTKK